MDMRNKIAKVVRDTVTHTTPYGQGYQQGLQDAMQFVAEFPSSRLLYRPASGVNPSVLTDFWKPGVCLPVDEMGEDIQEMPLSTADLKAAVVTELRLLSEGSVEPQEDA